MPVKPKSVKPKPSKEQELLKIAENKFSTKFAAKLKHEISLEDQRIIDEHIKNLKNNPVEYDREKFHLKLKVFDIYMKNLRRIIESKIDIKTLEEFNKFDRNFKRYLFGSKVVQADVAVTKILKSINQIDDKKLIFQTLQQLNSYIAKEQKAQDLQRQKDRENYERR